MICRRKLTPCLNPSKQRIESGNDVVLVGPVHGDDEIALQMLHVHTHGQLLRVPANEQGLRVRNEPATFRLDKHKFILV